MKRITLALCAAAFLFACNSETKPEEKTASAVDSPLTTLKEEPFVPVDSATAMKNWEAYMTPGPMHELLASWNGTWKADMTSWDYEGAEPRKMTGTAVNTMVMGGRYQSSKHTASMMGMPFEGHSITGFDNATKKFTSVWYDIMGTGIMTMTGDWNESAKTLTMNGSMPDMNRPGKECKMREVFTVVDDNTQKMEMYCPDMKTGKEYKMMEMTMTRVKK